MSEGSISPEWQPRYNGAFLLVVALSQTDRVTEGLRLLCELDEGGQFDVEIVRNEFRGVVSDASELDKGIEYCGLKFKTLVHFGCFQPEDCDLLFGESRDRYIERKRYDSNECFRVSSLIFTHSTSSFCFCRILQFVMVFCTEICI
jgi:hypothetical protein